MQSEVMTNDAANRNIKELKKKYYIVFASLFVFAFLAQVFVQYFIFQQQEYARALNQAGRQRMVSQRILLQGTQIVHQPDFRNDYSTGALKKQVEDFIDTHNLLKTGSPRKKIPRPFSDSIEQKYQDLDQSVEQIATAATCIVQKCSEINSSLDELDRLSQHFLTLMDDVVSENEAYVRSQVIVLSVLEGAIFIMILLLLFSGFFYILLPYHRNIEWHRMALEVGLKAGGVGIWDYELKADNLKWDEALMELYDQDPKEFTGNYESWSKIVHPDDLPSCAEEFKATLRTGKKFSSQFRIITRDGSIKYIKALANVLRGADGLPYRVIGANWDVTADVKRQMVLEESKFKAEQANQAKDIFLANLSHEIRTPLSAIIGFTDAIIKKVIDPERQRMILSRIHSNGQQLKLLVDDLFDLSKIKAGKIQIAPAQFNLVETTHDVIASLDFQAQKARCELSLRAESNEITVISDAGRVKQILFNLIGNAIKFSPGGLVEIVLSEYVENNQNFVAIDVVDNGVGIMQPLQDRIFEPFIQENLKPACAVDNSGTGLGLFICKTVSDNLQGSISLVRSSPEQGSHFRVVLPKFISNGIESIA